MGSHGHVHAPLGMHSLMDVPCLALSMLRTKRSSCRRNHRYFTCTPRNPHMRHPRGFRSSGNLLFCPLAGIVPTHPLQMDGFDSISDASAAGRNAPLPLFL
ncbi:unnamed protein product, partial [Laminaria digitata]